MPAINHPINLHGQDNPVSPGFYLYQDKILSRNTPGYFASVVDVLRVNGGTFYRITPLTLNPFKAETWYDHLHMLTELLERECRFWGPIDFGWLLANFDCKDVDYRKPLKWTQPKRLPKEEDDA
jgi:hypothetical protein